MILDAAIKCRDVPETSSWRCSPLNGAFHVRRGVQFLASKIDAAEQGSGYVYRESGDVPRLNPFGKNPSGQLFNNKDLFSHLQDTLQSIIAPRCRAENQVTSYRPTWVPALLKDARNVLSWPFMRRGCALLIFNVPLAGVPRKPDSITR